MSRTSLSILGVSLALTLGWAVPALCTDYYCVPLETAVLENRAHVLCAEPIFTRLGYPRDPPNSSNRIAYFAVPLTDAAWANRMIQMANTAQASGLTLRVSYTSGDISGQTFGCAPHDCRTPWALALLEAPPPWPKLDVFRDGFESGDTSRWASQQGGP